MLQRVVASKDAVIATFALVRHELALNTEEWHVVEEVIPILKTFYEITIEICTEKQISLSKVIVYCHLLHQHISNCSLQVYRPETQKMITCLEAQIHRRFYDKNDVESNVLYAEATILDPRFKRSVQKRLRGHRIRRHQYGRNLTKKLPHLSRVTLLPPVLLN